MDGYLLLDSGEGRKLEQYGEIVLSRPDPEACWPRSLDPQVWEEAHAIFESKGERNMEYKKGHAGVVENYRW
jgi:23S rRNA (cytosine1962-C5)-methyltransferase